MEQMTESDAQSARLTDELWRLRALATAALARERALTEIVERRLRDCANWMGPERCECSWCLDARAALAAAPAPEPTPATEREAHDLMTLLRSAYRAALQLAKQDTDTPIMRTVDAWLARPSAPETGE
jgi:hypothetical protein